MDFQKYNIKEEKPKEKRKRKKKEKKATRIIKKTTTTTHRLYMAFALKNRVFFSFEK